MRIAMIVAVLVILAACAAPSTGNPVEPTRARVYVVNTGDDSVSLVDLKAMREVARFPVGADPYGIALSADGRVAAIGVEGEERIKFFSLPGFEPLGEHIVGPMHHDHMLRSPHDDTVIVANYDSDHVLGVDFATMGEVFRIPGASGPHAAKIGPRTGYVYVTCKKVTGIASFDVAERELVAFHPLKVNPRGLSFFADEDEIYFGSFWVDGFFEYDVASASIVRKFEFSRPGDAPSEVTFHGVEAIESGLILAANEGRSFVDLVDTETGALLDRFTDVARPCCLARIPGSQPPRVLISNLGDDTVQVVEVRIAKTPKIVPLGRVQVGAGPKRVAFER